MLHYPFSCLYLFGSYVLLVRMFTFLNLFPSRAGGFIGSFLGRQRYKARYCLHMHVRTHHHFSAYVYPMVCTAGCFLHSYVWSLRSWTQRLLELHFMPNPMGVCVGNRRVQLFKSRIVARGDDECRTHSRIFLLMTRISYPTQANALQTKVLCISTRGCRQKMSEASHTNLLRDLIPILICAANSAILVSALCLSEWDTHVGSNMSQKRIWHHSLIQKGCGRDKCVDPELIWKNPDLSVWTAMAYITHVISMCKSDLFTLEPELLFSTGTTKLQPSAIMAHVTRHRLSPTFQHPRPEVVSR